MKQRTIADRVRAFLRANKPGYGEVDTDESVEITSRAAARRYVRGSGPWQHFTVSRDDRTRKPGRARRKREEQRQRAAGAIR
jgi:hypothetical protein